MSEHLPEKAWADECVYQEGGAYFIRLRRGLSGVSVSEAVARKVRARLESQDAYNAEPASECGQDIGDMSDFFNCHREVAAFFGLRDSEEKTLTGHAFADLLPKPSAYYDTELFEALSKAGPPPLVMQVWWPEHLLHSCVYLGCTAEGAHIIFEKEGWGFRFPWQLTTTVVLRNRYPGVQWSFASEATIREKLAQKK